MKLLGSCANMFIAHWQEIPKIQKRMVSKSIWFGCK